MIKKTAIIVIVFFALSFTASFADEGKIAEEGKKAEEIHKIVNSDVIYTYEELKALYHQNIQIIELLKEIRSLLKEQLEKQDSKR